MYIGAENRSIKQVLTLVFMVAVLLLALLLAMMAARQVFDYLKKDAISDTFKIAERLAKDSRLAIIQLAPENVISSVRMALDFPNIEGIVLFEKQGTSLLGVPPKEVSFDEIVMLDFDTDKAHLLKETPDIIFIVSPVIIETTDQTASNRDISDAMGNLSKASHRDLIGYVLLSLGKAELNKTRQQVWRESLIVITLISSVFLLVLIHAVNRITKPIRELARFMTHPDTAKHYLNAPIKGVKEMRDISSSFNALMGALEHSNNELLLSNEKLEARVLERTQDLKQARDEAQKFNKENRALIGSMNSAVEEERKFIARELHDHLNAELLFIKLKLRRLKAASEKQDADATQIGDSVEELIDRISNVYDSSRNIVTMLRPEVMDSLGLIGAIEERIDMFNRSQPDCTIAFEHEGYFAELDYPISIAIFRIVQESLTNASKHAQATDIKINLCLNCNNFPSGIYLCVSDNGKGFDTQVSSHCGIGLISMRERTFALNGQLKVESTIGLGTRIIACIPLLPKYNYPDSQGYLT
jgi:signal transduction histidine kinase